MKVKNIEMVNFWNGVGAIQKKRLPIRLSYALKLNMDAVWDKLKVYQVEHDRLKKEGKAEELNELILAEVEVEIQKVKFSDLAKMDDNTGYDALTGQEFAIIDFMIDKE